jgi:hypothetical protein
MDFRFGCLVARRSRSGMPVIQPGRRCLSSRVRPVSGICTAHGEGGLELRRGLRYFAPGAKVWVLLPQWGDAGAQVIVAGYHRGTQGRPGAHDRATAATFWLKGARRLQSRRRTRADQAPD